MTLLSYAAILIANNQILRSIYVKAPYGLLLVVTYAVATGGYYVAIFVWSRYIKHGNFFRDFGIARYFISKLTKHLNTYRWSRFYTLTFAYTLAVLASSPPSPGMGVQSPPLATGQVGLSSQTGLLGLFINGSGPWINASEKARLPAQKVLMPCPEAFADYTPLHCSLCGGESPISPGKCKDPNASGWTCECELSRNLVLNNLY